MKVLSALFLASLTLIACGDDNGTETDGTSSTTTNNPDTSSCEPTAGESAITGVNVNVTETNPNPNNDGCTGPITTGQGVQYPWGGETYDGVDYTCNACLRGIPGVQGAYRVHGMSLANGDVCTDTGSAECVENYSTPSATGTEFIETFWIDGNTWRLHQKNGGAIADITMQGYFFCTMKPQSTDERLVFVITEADPGNVTGLQAGDKFHAETKFPGNATNFLMIWGGDTNQYKYCRYGETDPLDNTCADPFGEAPCQ